jgi:tetratricopeptide (TPR) repeat protein
MSRAFCLRIALVFMFLTNLARAQSENPPGYDAAIDQALAAFDHGQFADARELFLRAHKILPNARTLRALGKTEYELKRYDEAASHLQLALDAEVRPLTTQQRAETEALLHKSEDFLATYTLRLEPAAAELKLDGAPVGLDANEQLRLIAGDHTLEASAPAYLPWQRELSVVARQDVVLSVQLSPLVQEAPLRVEQAPHAAHEDAPPRKRRWLLWTSLGCWSLPARSRAW